MPQGKHTVGRFSTSVNRSTRLVTQISASERAPLAFLAAAAQALRQREQHSAAGVLRRELAKQGRPTSVELVALTVIGSNRDQ